MNIRTLYGSSGLPALLLLCMLSLPARSSAQSLPSFAPCQGGTTFIISFPDTVRSRIDPRFPSKLEDRTQLFLYSTTDTKATITNGDGSSTTVTLKQGKFTTYDVPSFPFTTEIDTPNDRTTRVEAEAPIVVYCYFVTAFGGEAFTAIPVEAWGTDYAVASSPGEIVRDVSTPPIAPTTTKAPAPEEALILAAFDNTTVTVIPAADLIGLTQPITFTLDANQAYLVQNFVDTSDGAPQVSIAGSRIVADKPIGVISGNTRAQVIDRPGITANSFKNTMVEWLPPTDQHGTKFVYMPTWDDNRITGDPNERVEEKRQAEYIRIYGTASEGIHDGSYDNSGTRETFDVPASDGGAYKYRVVSQEIPSPIYVQTDQPAMAMMNSSSAVKFNGTVVYYADLFGASYDAKGAAYMVEMTPREQWVDFAPFLAPPSPSGMTHYINVVTDSASLHKVVYNAGTPETGSEEEFVFNRGPIPGSDLVWGTMKLVPGTDYYLRGLDSAVRFYGFVYGTMPGYELFRPFEPSEYEEQLALAYGYPLAPSRCVISTSDVPATPDLSEFGLRAVGPNPFRHGTTIEFSLERSDLITIRIFAADGRRVATLAAGTMSPGSHSVEWNAAESPAGLYYCRITSGNCSASIPLMLLK